MHSPFPEVKSALAWIEVSGVHVVSPKPSCAEDESYLRVTGDFDAEQLRILMTLLEAFEVRPAGVGPTHPNMLFAFPHIPLVGSKARDDCVQSDGTTPCR